MTVDGGGSAATRGAEMLTWQPGGLRSRAMFHVPPLNDLLCCSYAPEGVDPSTALLTGGNVMGNFCHCNGFWTLFTTNCVLCIKSDPLPRHPCHGNYCNAAKRRNRLQPFGGSLVESDSRPNGGGAGGTKKGPQPMRLRPQVRRAVVRPALPQARRRTLQNVKRNPTR
jgi:hypothetical protein